MPKLRHERTKRRFENVVAPRNTSAAKSTASVAPSAEEVVRAWAASHVSANTTSVLPSSLKPFDQEKLTYAASTPDTLAPRNTSATAETRRRIIPTDKYRRTRGLIDDNKPLDSTTDDSGLNTSSLLDALPTPSALTVAAASAVVTAKDRRRVRQLESAQLNVVMRHSAFTSDPFNAIHQHLIAVEQRATDIAALELDRQRIEEQRRAHERRVATDANVKEKSLIERLSSAQLTAAAKRRARAKLHKLNNR